MINTKENAKLTAEESEIYEAYATELAAHETEIVLGNEEFIDRIIAEDGSAAERLVSRLLSLDKGLSSMKDKQARSQAKLIKQAEKLYLKAAESAGNKRIMKMILAQRPELEEELTGINEEKMQVGENITTTIQFSKKGNTPDPETQSIKSQLKDHLAELNEMDPVSSVEAESMKNISISARSEKIMESYNKKFRGGIERQGLGFVELTQELVREGFKYLSSDGEFAAYFAIPNVIKRGKIFSGHEDHKGRAYSTITIAAPVLINGQRGNLAVVIRKTGKYRYKMHRILMPDGSAFIFKNKTEANSTNADMPSANGSQGTTIELASNNSISHSAEKSTENTKKVAGSDKNVQLSLKEKNPLEDTGDFFADKKDSWPVYKVSGGKVRKVIADNTRMKVYTRAESEQIVNQIVAENLSFGELYGSLHGKSRREAIDLLWNGLNSADVGEQGNVALDVAEYIINNAAVESIYDGEGLEVYRDTVAALKPYLHKMDLSGIKGDISHHYGKDSIFSVIFYFK